jgi:hypothetical protein
MYTLYMALVAAGMAVSNIAASPKLIQAVPAYDDYWGTGPTAGMMVIAYWDAHGYPDLIPGDAGVQTPAVDTLIASQEHIADYANPLDRPAAILPDAYITAGRKPHPDNSLADLMGTSQSEILNPTGYNSDGWMWFGVERWMQAHNGPQLDVCYGQACDTRLDLLDGSKPLGDIYARVTSSLDLGDPVVAVTAAHDQNTPSDDFVVVVGYLPGSPAQLAYLDPKDPTHTLHWRHFVPANAPGSPAEEDDGFEAVLYFRPLAQ